MTPHYRKGLENWQQNFNPMSGVRNDLLMEFYWVEECYEFGIKIVLQWPMSRNWKKKHLW